MNKIFFTSIFLLSYNFAFLQNSKLNVFIKAHPIDDNNSLLKIDTAQIWEEGNISGIETVGIGFEFQLNNKYSIEPFIGQSYSRSYLIRTLNNFRYSHNYNNYYFATGLRLTRNLNLETNGFRFAVGTSFHILVSHNFSIGQNFQITESESLIKDQFNKIAVTLDLEINYYRDLFQIKNRQIGIRIGYTPIIQMIGELSNSQNPKFHIRGINLAAYLNLNKSERIQKE